MRRRKMMQRSIQKRRQQDFLEDEYDTTDGFVVDDDIELQDEYRKELDKITNKKKIQELARKYDKEIIRESGLGEIFREE